MTTEKCDDLRPRGSVQVACSCGCRWEWWVDALDPRLPDGPFFLDGCSAACVTEPCPWGASTSDEPKAP